MVKAGEERQTPGEEVGVGVGMNLLAGVRRNGGEDGGCHLDSS